MRLLLDTHALLWYAAADLRLPLAARQDAQDAGNLPGPHPDPFDRMLIAQALRRDLVLVSNERVFDPYGITRLWA